ncbi:HD domain-containing phosphohydrolase [Jeotgalibacillus sp. R-1-5s-1]|uniref:HD domain-containing phosphohydrolase n=1 Tax=Jeotgalibacillus sp. R-1-5s-1 TaxID=2555897 RepID=UPI001069916E|nr:HD domain-containing phosphohydrolase [Jeotgalibacillus sp. R-1-5s-1]TFE00177.1 HD-GYP domain-containing protein [Jeotgalibacillus sp. R-1-5s-1]
MSFVIKKKDEYIEQFISDSFDINLLARGDGTEIMVQHIAQGSLFYVYPSEHSNVMEFYYLLSGEITGEVYGETVILDPNDYFISSDLEEPVHFRARTDVTMLWVITEPTFHELSAEFQTLKNMVEMVEKKDRYTFQHNNRVAMYSVKIARKLKLPKEQLENLYISSVLHDVGKINIPEEVLLKPGRLTEEEFALIMRHPIDGAEMVKSLYFEGISTIILQHHERLNGSGYPYGLSGDDIVLEARIIAVSDTFDAMTEDRAYRKALSAQTAVDELVKLSGSHYDPIIVDTFVEILKDEGRI